MVLASRWSKGYVVRKWPMRFSLVEDRWPKPNKQPLPSRRNSPLHAVAYGPSKSISKTTHPSSARSSQCQRNPTASTPSSTMPVRTPLHLFTRTVSNSSPGAQFDQQYQSGSMTMREAWNASWNVNTTGTQVVTATFIPLLLKSQNPRLIFMASGTSTLIGTENVQAPINKTPAAGWPKTGLTFQNNIPAYRSAKCGMNMMMRGRSRPNLPQPLPRAH